MMHSTQTGSAHAARRGHGPLVSLIFALLTACSAWPSWAADNGLRIVGEILPGALIRARTIAGSQVELDGRKLLIDKEGFFIFGLGRDARGELKLTITSPDGVAETHRLEIQPREYDIQRIDGLPQGKVTPGKQALERIAREQKSIDAARAQRNATQAYREQFRWPVRGRISGVFGSQRILNGVARNPHSGLDIAVASGTPIVAPASGRIVLAAPDLYYSGNTVIIDHGLGLSSTLIHMSRMSVQAGEWVEAGDKVGEVGMTGRATGPHLHWGINWLDQRLDPKLLLPED